MKNFDPDIGPSSNSMVQDLLNWRLKT